MYIKAKDGKVECTDKAMLFYAREHKVTVIVEPGEEEGALEVLIAVDDDWFEHAYEQTLET